MTGIPRIIDAHTHITVNHADLAVAIMDAAGVAAAVVCEWFDGFGATLDEHLAAFARHPGRFFVFGNVDLTRIDEPDFGRAAADELARGAAAGMRGLKVYKGLGLGAADATGQRLRVDDARLDPVWAAAGDLGLPVLIHTADPRAFWEPINEHNPWQRVFAAYPQWSYYRTGAPSRDELLAERNNVIRRHGGTNFIGPHLGSWEDDFQTLAENLDAMPNLHVDLSARFYSLAATPRRVRAARELFAEFPERILFGTDLILVYDTALADIQPQTFLTPDRLPANLAGAGDRMLFATSVWFYEFHKTFLASGRTQSPIPFLSNDPAAALPGLNLPAGVLEAVCGGNIERLLGL